MKKRNKIQWFFYDLFISFIGWAILESNNDKRELCNIFIYDVHYNSHIYKLIYYVSDNLLLDKYKWI